MAGDIDSIIVRIAEIMISELKLEDVTADKFDPDLDLVDYLEAIYPTYLDWKIHLISLFFFFFRKLEIF